MCLLIFRHVCTSNFSSGPCANDSASVLYLESSGHPARSLMPRAVVNSWILLTHQYSNTLCWELEWNLTKPKSKAQAIDICWTNINGLHWLDLQFQMLVSFKVSVRGECEPPRVQTKLYLLTWATSQTKRGHLTHIQRLGSLYHSISIADLDRSGQFITSRLSAVSLAKVRWKASVVVLPRPGEVAAREIERC